MSGTTSVAGAWQRSRGPYRPSSVATEEPPCADLWDPQPRPRYRIAHGTAAGTEVLSRHPADLAAFLEAERAGGAPVVVEEATGRDIVRRAIPDPARTADS